MSRPSTLRISSIVLTRLAPSIATLGGPPAPGGGGGEAAERCIQVVDLLQPVLVDQFASRPRALGVTTTLSVGLVEHCRIVLSECEEGYVREHPLREAFYGLNALNRRGYPKPALVTASRTEAEKVAYFKHLADEFKELALEVEASVKEWIDSDSGKSARWFDQPVKMRFDD
ncbi:hypothetical protein TRIUR3_04714 [Triticum urartu]|uniref:Uncharacterized protein n=1 Tax=Triticum urartu TaxID=4572 RepID=M8AXT0_TRIUA|nr:hypothetical protein TRIUR3_04714 [Triticum urartu]